MQLHESTVLATASLAQEAKQVLEYLNRCRDKKHSKCQSEAKFQSTHYHLQKKEDVQHKDVKMAWNNMLFPSLNIAENRKKIHGSTGIMSRYHFRVDPDLGQGKCTLRRIPCACINCMAQLDKP